MKWKEKKGEKERERNKYRKTYFFYAEIFLIKVRSSK